MKSFYTRYVSLILATGLVIGTIGGCGDNSSSETSDQYSSESTEVVTENGTETIESTEIVEDSENFVSETETIVTTEMESEEDIVSTEDTESVLATEIATENVEETTEVVADDNSNSETTDLVQQETSISMLNYLTVIAEEINQSSSSRLFLESVQDSLFNDLYPNAIDKKTQSYITNMMYDINDLRMVAVKRDRLAYIYEQNKAKAMKQAIPSPISIMNVVQSKSMLQALASATYLAIDSYASYKSAEAEVDLSYLQDGWELDDSEQAAIDDNKIEAFNYMEDIVRDNHIENGDLALNSNSVDAFVKKGVNQSNLALRIQFLESNEETYSAYGGYWLLLSKSYYERKDYQKCLDSLETYIQTQPRLFRKDEELASVLPFAIASLEEVYSGDELTEKEIEYTAMLDKNTTDSDWELKYFAALAYLDIYGKTTDTYYLNEAYDIAKNNVVELIADQDKLNETYLADIVTQTAASNATKDEKKEIKEYNKMLEEDRKTELPPVDNALLINIQLLFSVADQLNINSTEKQFINDMIHPKDSPVFLTSSIDNEFWYGNVESEKMTGTFDGKTLSIPASYVCSESKITVTIKSGSSSNTIDDWTIKEVERPKNSTSADEFTATYTSSSIKSQKYSSGDTVEINIYPYGDEIDPIKMSFKVQEKKILLYTSYEFVLNN